MSDFYPKYQYFVMRSNKRITNRVFTTSSLYGHFCKIHRILSVFVLILYIIGLSGLNDC
ncbi:hypothetical protein VB264_01935 [Arcicella aquatica]|uniref:Uncharacterized protein n=1 Tax=Arcicella aquatica TaxID=217141 RepID=A0ABU5QHJ9_9BACT|nr:hypothetical protein [Arcicella aquatica]MEA5256523.1 hypothetical protein [Arcicella aquatica]